MASVNKVIIVGNVGRDPELRHTSNGNAVANLSVATSRNYKRGNEQVNETEWHRVVAWGKLAETVGEYVRKGAQVYVEGRLQTRQWEDREGNKRYTTEIVAENVQFLSRSGNGGTQSQTDSAGGQEEVDDGDIPF